MKIVQNFYALFWSHGGKHPQQFHADVPANVPPQEAVRAFRAAFPRDTVHSVRDASGRFLAFKEAR